MSILNIYQKNSSVLLVGPIPPPLGGVSVHLKRLKNMLNKKGYKTAVFYTSRQNKSIFFNSIRLFHLLRANNYDVVHIHGYFRAYILIILLTKTLKKYRIFYTAHNPRLFDKKYKINRVILRRFIEKLDCLVVVANHILENFEENKVKISCRLMVQNAFLPPPLEEEKGILQSYLPETHKFIYSHKPLIIANAWQINFYQNVDLYGLDLCIELTSRLKKEFPKIGFLFALANQSNYPEYIELIKNRIIKLKLSENFYIMKGQKELWPLFKKADLCIRPTVTDGDAISVREALYFKCPVIASDVIRRPEGTITFENRNIDKLYLNVRKILKKTTKNT